MQTLPDFGLLYQMHGGDTCSTLRRVVFNTKLMLRATNFLWSLMNSGHIVVLLFAMSVAMPRSFAAPQYRTIKTLKLLLQPAQSSIVAVIPLCQSGITNARTSASAISRWGQRSRGIAGASAGFLAAVNTCARRVLACLIASHVQ